jgi:pSer/pThr/pTyr-binding forkhead associated (FHA) protein/two-component sensor histidine kinase
VHELLVIAGPDAGARHALPDGEPQLIGRSTEALGSRDPTVSRRHAELTPSDGRWWIADLASTHGTLVNGERIGGRVPLREGDRIRCGQTEFAFARVEGAVAGVPTGPGAGGPGGLDAGGTGGAAHADPERLRTIGQTVATLSHSVKNILQGLRSGADAVELALQRGDLAMAREGWPIVARNLDRISWLVMNMLAFAKERPLEIAPADLGAVVREVRDLMQATAARRRVRLTADVADDLPPAPMDANAIHQILLNLVANAVEAAPDRTGHVVLRARHDAARDRLTVSVEDDGPGVPAAQRARLFQPFASTKGQRGTGLGLAVAQKLAEQHLGAVRHADRPGGGTVMTLDLPATREDPDSERTRGPVPGPAPDIAFER